MFGHFGIEELLILLVIVIILFGPGRIGKIAGELGSGIKAFKDGLNGNKKEGEENKEPAKEPTEQTK
jgi:sec-independent protein translocase protein TatA